MGLNVDVFVVGILRIIIFLFMKLLECICFIISFPDYFKKPQKCPAMEDKILFYTATELAEKIRNREITCEAVIKSYIQRIKTVNPILNAVVEDRFEEALKEAKYVDDTIATTTLTTEELKTKYPLLGLPITIKGSIACKSLDHGTGSVFPKGKKGLKDAVVVKLIRDAGAIVMLVSNTSEQCTVPETFNNVTGTTNNPYDTRKTPGGTSGGEAALLGAGASLLGIGSDLLGSIRIPASYCGVWAHKPSPGVVSLNGHYPDCREKEVWDFIFTFGPLCRYADDLLLLYKTIAEKPLQLDQQVSLHNLKFYLMENDGGSILTHRVENDILVALRRFKRHLESKYEVKVQELFADFTCVETVFMKALSLKVDTLFDDKGKDPYLELLNLIIGQSKTTGGPILHAILQRILFKLPAYFQAWPDRELSRVRKELVATLGTDGVLLYPTHPRAAQFHGQWISRTFDYHYTGLFNGLGLPATTCPVGLNSEGLPIGIQVIAGPYNDRLTLAVAKEIEIAFGGWIPPTSKTIN